jgi:hypothetical protein
MSLNIDELLPADLILVKGNDNNILQHGIELVTDSNYFHVAGISLDGRLIEAQGFTKTRYVDIDYYKGRSDVYRMEKLTDKQREKIVKGVMKRIGNDYDYLAIAWELIRYELHIDLPFEELNNSRICSTLWAIDGFRANKIQICDWTKFPSPGDLALEKKFKYIGSF